MKSKIIATLLLCFTGISSLAQAGFIHGKNDGGITPVLVKVKESGHTIKRLHMLGFCDNATLILDNGFCVKPSLLIANGGGSLLQVSLGAGYFIPVCQGLYVTPQVALSYGTLDTYVPFAGISISEEQRSWTPAIGLDASYTITPRWVISGSYLYGWSLTHTDFGPLLSNNSHSEGSSYKVQLDYYLTECLSVNAAFAYNNSLSKEKHGVLAMGGRLGLGVCF